MNCPPFNTSLDDVSADHPGVLELLCRFLSQYMRRKLELFSVSFEAPPSTRNTTPDLFRNFCKDKAKLTTTKSLLEAGAFRIEVQVEKDKELMVGLLLMYLRLQAEPLFPFKSYAKLAFIISETKGSSALCKKLEQCIDSLSPGRSRALRAVLRMLSIMFQHNSTNGMNSGRLASLFCKFIFKHPPLDYEFEAPDLSKVQLTGALALLIENYTVDDEAEEQGPVPTPPPKKADLGKDDLIAINLKMAEEILNELDAIEGRALESENDEALKKLRAVSQALK